MKKVIIMLLLGLVAAAAGCISTGNTAQTATTPTATPTAQSTPTTTTTHPAYNLVPQEIITVAAMNADRMAIQYVKIENNTLLEHFRLERTAVSYEKNRVLTVVYNGKYARTEMRGPQSLIPTLVYSVNGKNYVLFYDGYETLAAPVLRTSNNETIVTRVPIYVLDDDNLYPAGYAKILYTPVTTASTLTNLPTYINPQAITTHHLQSFMDANWTDITNSLYRLAAGETSTQKEKTNQIIMTFTASPAVTYISINYAYTSLMNKTTSYQRLYIVLNYTGVLEYNLTYNAPGTHVTMNINKTIGIPCLDGTTAYTEFYPPVTTNGNMITFLWFTLTLPEDGHWTSTEYESGTNYCYCYTTIRDIETP